MLKLTDEKLLRRDAYIDGAWVGAPARFKVDDPATGDVLAEVADLGEAETRAAIERAHAAFPAWAAKTGKERAAILRKWFDLIMAAQEDLARIMTAEQGKPLSETRGEVAYGASFIEWFGEEAKRIYGDVIPTNAHGRRLIVLKQPIGVVGAITPWNFPNAMITRKVAPALAAGCPVVIKPPSETPLSALALAELADRAGVPKGVFNVVTTSRSAPVGLELTTNPLVKKFSFTGSTEVGKLLMKQCASTVKKVSLELGGNAPFIVFDDADLDAAADGAIVSKFRNMGQTCVCANRILVQNDVYDAFAEKFAARVAKLKVGNGFDDGVQQGPLITQKAVEKVEHLLKEAVAHGAKIALAEALNTESSASTLISTEVAPFEGIRHWRAIRHGTPHQPASARKKTHQPKWFEIEAHAADAMAELGVIPKAHARARPRAIWEKVWERRDAKFDVERIDEIEREVKHDVIAFLTHVSEIVGPEARFLHQGMTSSDVLDTCLSVQLPRRRPPARGCRWCSRR
jgi:succinate-semialdehyde dehydrogenase/glutarate-semialdehyde dehydrogenase